VRPSFQKMSACQRGATAVEYGLILALIVLVMLGALTEMAGKTIGMWNHISSEVANR